jgi:hypothetical protein
MKHPKPYRIHGRYGEVAGFYARKPHNCPVCGHLLALEKRHIAVTHKTFEADIAHLSPMRRKYARSTSFRTLSWWGRFFYFWYVLYCPHCMTDYEVEDVLKAEGIKGYQVFDNWLTWIICIAAAVFMLWVMGR